MTPRSILLIDDDPYLPRIIELGLVRPDLTFQYAPNGREGVRMAEAEPPDLVLLDFDMPLMDGLATLERLRANCSTRRHPVIAITGALRPTPRCAEMIAGCDAYVPKPIHVGTLRRMVARFLDGGAECGPEAGIHQR